MAALIDETKQAFYNNRGYFENFVRQYNSCSISIHDSPSGMGDLRSGYVVSRDGKLAAMGDSSFTGDQLEFGLNQASWELKDEGFFMRVFRKGKRIHSERTRLVA